MATGDSIPRRLRKWRNTLSAWLSSPAPRRAFFEEPSRVLEEILAGGGNPEKAPLRAERIGVWHLRAYQLSCLEGTPSLDDLGKSTAYASASLDFESIVFAGTSPSTILLDVAARALALTSLCNWPDAFSRTAGLLLDGLGNSLLQLGRTQEHASSSLFRHFWFVLELGAKVVNRSVMWSEYVYPDDMSPYGEALDNWRTTDHVLLSRIVSALCDFHVAQSRSLGHDQKREFDDADGQLFPYEVLAFLRVRQWWELHDPEEFAHPLMQQPLAVLPPEVGRPIETVDMLARVRQQLSPPLKPQTRE